MQKKLISIIIPLLNEEEILEKCYSQICTALNNIDKDCHFEFIFMDNFSEDQSFKKLQKIARKDKRVKVVSLSKNFG